MEKKLREQFMINIPLLNNRDWKAPNKFCGSGHHHNITFLSEKLVVKSVLVMILALLDNVILLMGFMFVVLIAYTVITHY